jgi:hypothetical protein
MKQRPRSFLLLLLAAIAIFILSPRFLNGEDVESLAGKSLTIEKKQAKSGNHYTIFHKNECSISFVVERPSKDDKTIALCIAAAFTDLETYGVEGVCISDGKKCNDKVNHGVGGAFRIKEGKYTIFPTSKGKLLTDSLLDVIIKNKGSLFQQIQMVTNGKAATFKDKASFQRRAIIETKKGWAVIESEESIMLEAFAKDMVELGAVNALYTDMGSWDEGWYRDPATGKNRVIGQIRTETDKQTNWIIFKIK